MLCTYDVMHSSSLKYLPGPARGIKGYPSPRTTPTYAPHWRCYPTPQSIATNTIAGVPNPSTTKLFLKPLKVKFINTPVRIWPSLISLSKNLIPRGSARRRKCLVSATLLVLVACWGSEEEKAEEMEIEEKEEEIDEPEVSYSTHFNFDREIIKQKLKGFYPTTLCF